MRGKIFFNCLLAFLLLLVIHYPAEGREEDLYSKIKISSIKGDKKAPDFSLKDLNGKQVGIKQFKGKVIFLNFGPPGVDYAKKRCPAWRFCTNSLEGQISSY